VIVYGRNPVREALRGKRAKQVREVWATARRAAGEPWLAGTEPRIAYGEEIEQRCGSASHQGVCAGRRGPIPMHRPTGCSPASSR